MTEKRMTEIQSYRMTELRHGMLGILFIICNFAKTIKSITMDSPLYVKSMAFAERILEMSDFLLEKSEYRNKYSLEVCVKQITRSGTSIAANVAEGTEAESKSDLAHKNYVALKEAKETKLWLTLLLHKSFINLDMYNSLLADFTELLKMLGSSIVTIRRLIRCDKRTNN